MRINPKALAFCALHLLVPPFVQAQNGPPSINVRSAVTTRVPVPNDACTVPQSNGSFLTTDPRVWVVFSYTGGNGGDSGQLEFLSPSGGTTFSANIQQSSAGGFYCYYYFISIAGFSPSTQPGNWRVHLLWNGQESFSLPFTIQDPVPAPISILGSSVLPGGTLGQPFSFRFSAALGVQPYAWSLGGGALPPGLTLDRDGTLSGIPTRIGSFQFQVRSSDSAGANVVQSFAVGIGAPSLIAQPGSLALYADASSGSHPSGKVHVSSSGSPAIFTTAVTQETGNNWLSVTSSSSSTPATLTIAADPTRLGPGTYRGTVTLVSSNTNPGQMTIPVTLSVVSTRSDSAPPPVISTFAGTDWLFPRSGSALDAPLDRPGNFATDDSGNIYLADGRNQVVVRISPDGTATVIAGNGIAGFSGDGEPATAASLNSPTAVARDQSGNLYVADSGNHVIRRITPDGVISTYAGTGRGAFNGDGLALRTAFNRPISIAIDAAGTLYVGDLGNARIRKISTDNMVVTIAGNGTAGSSGDGGDALKASIYVDTGLTTDRQGNVYISEFASNRIRRISTNGIITTFAGTGDYRPSADGAVAAKSSIKSPEGLLFDPAGNLLFAELNNHLIRMITPDGILKTFAGNGQYAYTGDGGPALQASFQFPLTIAMDSSSNVYVTDFANSRLRKIDANSIINTIAGNGQFYRAPDGSPARSAYFLAPRAIAFDGAGNLIIADTDNQRVYRLNADGSIQSVAGNGASGCCFDGGPATQALLNGPGGVAVDAKGNIFIAEYFNHRIRRVRSDGTISTYAGGVSNGFGGDGGPATNASLSFPYGLAVDAAGNLFIADSGNHRIRKVTPAGIISTVAGTGKQGAADGPASTATLNGPRYVALSPSGDLVIADGNNHKIRLLSPSGIVSTIAGTGQPGYTGDNGPATAAKIDFPSVVAVDAANNIYFAEDQGHRVRRISTDGIITTVAGTGKPALTGDGGPAAEASINAPYGLAFDGSGNLYVSEGGNHRVREIFASAPTFSLAPASLSFTAAADSAAPDPQSITVSSAVFGLPFSIQSRTSDGSGWLQADADSGTTPGTFRVRVDPSGLAPGTYTGTVTAIAASARPAIQSVPVTLTVKTSAPAVLAAEPLSLSFSFISGDAALKQSLRVLNLGSGLLDFSVSVATSAGGNWLSVNPQAGRTSAIAPFVVSVRADPASLAPGTYSGKIIVTSVALGRAIIIPVTISISKARPKLVLSQQGFTFLAVQAGGVTPAQSVRIINAGQGSFNWTATARTISGGSWLSLSSTSGTSVAGGPPSNLTIAVDPSGLDRGEYYGIVRVSAKAANSPEDIQILLSVLPATSNPGALVQPSGLVFMGVKNNRDPGSQTVQVTNLSSTTQLFAGGRLTLDGGQWFTAQPDSGQIAPGATISITVQAALAALSPGVHEGTLTVQVGNQARTVRIVFVVLPAATTGSTVARAAAGCTPSVLLPVFTSIPQQFNIPAQYPTPINLRVLDDCGSPLVSGRAYVRFSNGDPLLSLVNQGDGTWSQTWFGANSRSPQLVLTGVADQDTPILHGEYALNGSLAQNDGSPLVVSGGVLNAASGSLASRTPLAPGSLITISGVNLSNGQNTMDHTPWDTTLGGSEVLIAGESLPLLSANGTQIVAQLPPDLPSDGEYSIVVRRDNALSPPEPIVLAPYQPGIFLTDPVTGQGKIMRVRGSETVLADANHPAKAGDTIVIYCTGLGATEALVAAGQPAPDPGPKTVNPVNLAIGGMTAVVQFSGLANGTIGTYQVTATVPLGVRPGDGVPVVIRMGDQASPAATMSVR